MQEDQIVSNQKSKVSTTSAEIAKEIYAMRNKIFGISNEKIMKDKALDSNCLSVNHSELSLDTRTEQEKQKILNDIVASVFPNDINLYVSIISKLPKCFDDQQISWSVLYKSHIYSSKRDFKKWNELKTLLINSKLIELGKYNRVKKMFV